MSGASDGASDGVGTCPSPSVASSDRIIAGQSPMEIRRERWSSLGFPDLEVEDWSSSTFWMV